ncbi:hypothetical protein D7147_28890 [Micromonospora musae]|uniref:Uncharacterized protein n=1 Tax=Micromonospora musae TaxID=1894970 RepID=A0A3A9YCE3_9ACTN|nr:hypothetical protein D7147_28890 [Micromonospora musae]RKN34463.1 hypothetical protein D7044_06340 [Micromonospora musae]
METRGLAGTDGEPGSTDDGLGGDAGADGVDESVGDDEGDDEGERVPPVESAEAEPVGDAESQGGVGIGAPTSSPRGTSASERPR